MSINDLREMWCLMTTNMGCPCYQISRWLGRSSGSGLSPRPERWVIEIPAIFPMEIQCAMERFALFYGCDVVMTAIVEATRKFSRRLITIIRIRSEGDSFVLPSCGIGRATNIIYKTMISTYRSGGD